MKKTFFIDIDGVLVTDWSMRQELIKLDQYTFYEPYNPESVSALNMIIKALDPLLMIHSSRRYQYTNDDFRNIWKNSKISFNSLEVLKSFAEMDDKWFEHPNEEKEYDIGRFIILNNINPEDYLIIEDEKLNIRNVHIVDGASGLTIPDAEKIINSMN